MSAAMGQAVRCPDNIRWPGDIRGCGSVNVEGPDKEGVYDCLDCGIFFTLESIGEEEEEAEA
jgi:hypothetical protein